MMQGTESIFNGGEFGSSTSHPFTVAGAPPTTTTSTTTTTTTTTVSLIQKSEMRASERHSDKIVFLTSVSYSFTIQTTTTTPTTTTTTTEDQSCQYNEIVMNLLTDVSFQSDVLIGQGPTTFSNLIT